jgi:hypothetical protein
MSFSALASAQDTNVTLSVDAKPALVLKAPAAAKVISTNGFLRIQTANLTLYVWAVPNAKTANDALPRAADIIKSEFLKFKTNAIMDMVIAGAPAKHVTGSGNEADDGDRGRWPCVCRVRAWGSGRRFQSAGGDDGGAEHGADSALSRPQVKCRA